MPDIKVPRTIPVGTYWNLSELFLLADGTNFPGDLTPDKAFRRGNILGTVTQSGGVPTGALIERGSNANGEYTRWADGTQICWATVNIPGATQASGMGFITALADRVTWTYPAAFSVAPNAQGTMQVAGGVGVAFSSVGATTAVFLMTSFVSATGPFPAKLFAVGRWF